MGRRGGFDIDDRGFAMGCCMRSVILPSVINVALVLWSGNSNPSRIRANPANQPSPNQEEARNSYRDVVRRVLPSVVSIEAKAHRPRLAALAADIPSDEFQPYFDQPLRRRQLTSEMVSLGFGSGIVIDAQGIILTSAHVVEGADELEIRTHDGRRYRSNDVRVDRPSDLALVKVQPRVPLVGIEFANSDEMEMGDVVLAFGSPFGLRGSVSRGIISAKGRTLKSYTYEDFIQTDAAVNPGNSGGPLVNLEGKVIGVMTAIKSRSGGFQGVGLAVSSNLARIIADRLREKGNVHRGYLGLLVEDLDTDERERLGTAGVLVADVVAGSPAHIASLRRGDVVTQAAGQRISTAGALQKIVSFTPPGTRITLEILREGGGVSVPVTLSELPAQVPSPVKQP